MPDSNTRPPFEVIDFTEAKLYEALASEKCSLAEVKTNKIAAYLHRYLKDIGAQTIVIEHGYTDGDYLEDFASYYVRCFQGYDRKCKRLHFFAYGFNGDQFEQLVVRQLDETIAATVCDAYLGFVVARPLPNAIIGRTAVATYPPDNGRRNYTAVVKYRANLFGIPLSVKTLAFQEQDTVLAACATVSLWSAFHKTAEMFGTPAPRPAEITKVANGAGSQSRAIPSHGLNLLQMAHAVRAVGLEPEVIPAAPNLPLVSVVYAHLRLGLPVVIGVEVETQGLHAITLTGYSLLSTRVNSQEVASGSKSAPFVGLRINEFYGHDDQIGPFSRLAVKPSVLPSHPVEFEGSWKDQATGQPLAMRPLFLLVPVYNKIRVTFVDVQKWIERMWAVIALIITDDTDFEWDVYLTSTNDLKTRIATTSPRHVKQSQILLQQHPRFIWCAALCYKGVPLFELLADATDMERSMPFYELLWHDNVFRASLVAVLTTVQLKALVSMMLTERFAEFILSH